MVFLQNVSKCVFQLQLVIFKSGCKKDRSIQKVQDQFSVQVTWPVKSENKNMWVYSNSSRIEIDIILINFCVFSSHA